MTSALQKKLWRELWHIRGQALAIILVIVGGVGVCVMSISTYDSLVNMRSTYYGEYNFAHVFSSLKRAPESLLKRIVAIPGIANAESRVVAQVHLEVPGYDEPVTGLLTSLPDEGMPRINQLHLVSGRMPDVRRGNELLISDAFSEAQDLREGDSLIAVINGRRRDMQIVGVAQSPNHIFQMAPGAVFPDYERFGVLWMARTPLAVAYDMKGAFNEVVLTLQAGGDIDAVIQNLDILLKRYGSRGAYGREDQLSNAFLKEEFRQLQTMALLFPAIFLGVAVFLLNVVISRLVQTQREIIAVLRAFGYPNWQIGLHYSELILIIVALGVAGGFALGVYLGQLLTASYTDYYRFPWLIYELKLRLLIGVALVTICASALATWRAILRASSLPPAEAMRPELPQYYRQSILERLGLLRYLSQPSRMIVRHLQKSPVKTGLSILGIAFSVAIMMVGNFQHDAARLMLHVQFKLAQKQDIEVTLYEPVAVSQLSSFRAIEGVHYVEGMRNVPIRLHAGSRQERTGISGLARQSQLYHVLDTEFEALEPPDKGLMLSSHLGEKLGIGAGDTVFVETLEGRQRSEPVVVARLSEQYLGMSAYMLRENVNRLMGEGPAVNSILMSIDTTQAASIYATLRGTPVVAAINLRRTVIDSFQQTLDQVLLVFTLVNALLGSVIAFGVVYNTVRIALAERGRELASMRVLGYTQGEVVYILLGELGLLTLLGIPVGFLLGVELCGYMSSQLQSDLFRVPLVLSPFTYSFSALVVILSACVSGLMVWFRIRRLELVEVLKTRE